jgi:ATP-dependent RNA helicase DDX60
MRLHQTSQYSLPEALRPECCLPDIVSKSDVAHWESNLKYALQLWMKSPESPVRPVQAALLGGEKFRKLKHDLGSTRKNKAVRPTIISVVYDLHELGALPAIIFNHDRSKCEQGLQTMLAHLEKNENEWKQSDQEWQVKLERYEEWQRFQMRSKDTKQKQGHKKSRRKGSRDVGLDTEDKVSKNDRARDDADIEMSQWASFDPDAPLEKFSFGSRAKLAQIEFDEMTDGLDTKIVDDRILKALRRGIGVHHSGMNRRYRQM